MASTFSPTGNSKPLSARPSETWSAFRTAICCRRRWPPRLRSKGSRRRCKAAARCVALMNSVLADRRQTYATVRFPYRDNETGVVGTGLVAIEISEARSWDADASAMIDHAQRTIAELTQAVEDMKSACHDRSIDRCLEPPLHRRMCCTWRCRDWPVTAIPSR